MVLLCIGLSVLWITGINLLFVHFIDDPDSVGGLSVIKGIALTALAAMVLIWFLSARRCPAPKLDAEAPRDDKHHMNSRMIALVICLAMIVPLFNAFIIHLHSPRLQDKAFDDLSAIADLKADQIEAWLRERRKDVEMLALNPRFTMRVHEYLQLGDDSLQERIGMRLKDLTRTNKFEIDLLDEEGKARISIGEGHSPADALTRRILKRAFTGGETQLIDLHRGKDGHIRLSYLVPLFYYPQEGIKSNLGGLVFHMPAEDYLFPLIQAWPTPSPTAEIVLVRKDGDAVLFLNKLRHREGVELNQRYPISMPRLPAAIAVMSDHKQTLEGLDYRRMPVLAAVRPVSGTPWHLVGKMDRSEVMAPLKELVTWSSIVIFFAIVSITTAVSRLWRQQARSHALELRAQVAEKDRVLRHFYDLSLIGMAISSPVTKQTLHVNDEMCQIAGFPRDEMLKLTWPELIHPDHRSGDVAEYERLLAGEVDTYVRDTKLIRQDRTVIDITVNAQCVRDTDGQVELTIATLQDITGRKRMESALRESEANLNHAQRIAQIGSWALNIRQNSLTWSDECYRIFGITPGTALTYENFIDCVHADDRDLINLKWNNALHGAEYDVEHRIIVDDRIKWVRERAELTFDDAGHLTGGIGTAQDITARKDIEQRLQESEDIRKESQRIAAIGHYVFDVKSGIWTGSDTLDDLFGIDAGYPRNIESWHVLVHPEQREEMLSYLQNQVLRDLNPFDREYRIVRANDGAVRWLHGLGRIDLDMDGVPKRLYGTIQDITERIEVQTALRENEERLRQAVRASEIGIFDHDHHTDTIYWSPEQRRIFGWEPDDVITMTAFVTSLHPEDREWVSSAIARAHDPAHDGSFDVEHRIIHRNGTTRWVATRSQTGFEETAGVRHAARTVGAVLDITERKQTEITLRESKDLFKALEERFRVIFESALDGILVADPETGKLFMGNPSMARMLGYTCDEIPGLRIADIVREADLAAAMDQFEKHKRGEISQTANFPMKRRDGSVFFINIHSTSIRLGDKAYLMGMVRDVSDQMKNEEHLRLAAAVFENSREGILVTDADQNIVLVNRALCRLKGYEGHELVGHRSDMLQSGRHSPEFYAAMWECIRTTGNWQGEIWNRHRNGALTPVLMSISAIRDGEGDITHYVGITTDISTQKSTEARLEFMAHHDSLTQLPNRLLMHSRIEHSVQVARRENRRLVLLMLDLDNFKDVNDSFGHLAGDELLQQVSKRLSERLRSVDTVARLGGDEFAVLLDNPAHQEDAIRIAHDMISALSESWHLSNGVEVRVGVSVGISMFPEHGQDADSLLQQADAALYRAKAEGRGCARFFTDDMTLKARQRLEIESRLRRAIQQDELHVYYQPQVDIASGCIIGAEALLRWHNPEWGIVPPGVFIPVAEETGLISEIGSWVLKETCQQGQRWIASGLPPLTLSVNLSPHQFLFNDIWVVVKEALADSGFPPERLELELTESALMSREGASAETLNRLRDQGVRLAIDDFGTGYSSLAYLKHFSIDVLKIDKRFIDDIPHEEDDKAITAAIVAMAHTLGFEVTAEGVETPEQLAFLRAQGCDHYQGYLVSPAVPADEFAELLAGTRQTNSRVG